MFLSTRLKLVNEQMKYSNALTSLVSKAISDSGGKSTPEIWNPMFYAIQDIFEIQVKEYYKMDSSSLVKFFVNDGRFIPGTHPRAYYVINDKKETVGVLWFKHMLGGWRLRLENDTDALNWETRGVIETKEQFEKSFNHYLVGKKKEELEKGNVA